MRHAIRLIVTEGLTQAEAARASGMKANSLQIALHKPHVQAYVTAVKRAWLESRTFKSWINVANLADHAASEDVRLKANLEFLKEAGEIGGSPDAGAGLARQMVQILINAPHSVQHLTSDQVPGVYEAKPYQPVIGHASNSNAVGCEDDDDG